jgi:phosphatidylinositol alpha-1,6-mannosyltransferase
MERGTRGTLGLLPSFEPIGGIQTSGRLAWDALARDSGSVLFCYGEPSVSRPVDARVVSARTKAEAVLAALRREWHPRRVLVWHISLLRLLPFLRLNDTPVALCLLGIEAWAQQDWLTRMNLRRVNLFLSISDYTWSRFVDLNPECGATPHRTVHLGIGEPAGANAAAPGDPPAALMLGRLARSESYSKGHRELIAAWPLVQRRIPGAQLWIAGDGDLRAELERLVTQHHLDGAVRFWGLVSEERKHELVARCRCLALPSRGEGFGLVYLEAMRLGRPCLVSTVDAGREVVSPPEAGLAADPDDPQALADSLCRLLTPGPEWDSWSQHARERYEASFTARHFQDRLLAALEQLDGQTRKR